LDGGEYMLAFCHSGDDGGVVDGCEGGRAWSYFRFVAIIPRGEGWQVHPVAVSVVPHWLYNEAWHEDGLLEVPLMVASETLRPVDERGSRYTPLEVSRV
jgi:hypothetical protein